MATYTVELSRSSRKELEGLSPRVRERIAEALRILSHSPYSRLLNIKKLQDRTNLYRLRVGEYRVVYEVRKERLVIIVIRIGHRREVYRR